MTRIIAALGVVFLVLTPRAADAQPTDELDDKARAHFTRGQNHVAGKRYTEALAEFSAGYELSKRPAFLFNMAECARLAGDDKRAVELYQQFLRDAPQHAQAPTAQQRLGELGTVVKTTGKPKPEVKPEPKPKPKSKSKPDPSANSDALKFPTPEPGGGGRDDSQPIWNHWGFWAGVGAVVVVGAVTTYAVTRDGGIDCDSPSCLDFRMP